MPIAIGWFRRLCHRNLAFLVLCLAACADQNGGPWVVYKGGTIVTMESDETVESVVTGADGRIAFVGSLEEAKRAYSGAIEVDLGGRTMMPGFIDPHIHPFLGALTLEMAVIAPEEWRLPDRTWPAVNGNEAYVGALTEALAADSQSGVFWTWGFNQYFHGEIDRSVLNDISATRPIGVWHRSVHEFYVNDAFLEHFGVEQTDIDAMGPEVAGQVDLSRGHFFEAGAMLYLLPRIFPDLGSPARFEAGLKQMVEMLHSKGITTFAEPGAFIPEYAVPIYERVLGDVDTPLTSLFIPEAKTPYYDVGAEGVLDAVRRATDRFSGSSKVRFLDGQVKLLIDGAIVSQLMQMKDGYIDGHHGEWIQPPEDIETLSKIFWEEGYQIHVHVNGDLGLDELITIFERRQQEFPRSDHRFTVVHFANSTEEQVERLADLGAIVSANPYYVTGFGVRWGEVGLGPERAHAMVRLAPAEALGMSISLHSDMPIAPADPLFLAWSAVTRRSSQGAQLRPDLALSAESALRAITIDAAYSIRMEEELGSIRVGKVANFTILDRNPLQTPAEEWINIEVLETVYEGRSFPMH